MSDQLKKVSFHDLAPYVRLVQNIKGDDRYRLPPRIIYDYELIYVTGGTCIYHMEEQEYRIQSGDLLLMPPLVRHSCYVPPNDCFHYYAVHFDLTYMGENYDFSVDDVYMSHDYSQAPFIPDDVELTKRPKVVMEEIEFPYVMKIGEPYKCEMSFEEMHQAFIEQYYGYQLRMRSSLLSILSQMTRELGTNAGISKRHPQLERIQQAVDWMRKHSVEPIVLNDIAQSVYLSPGHFRTLFKEATGKTPIEFLIRIRLEKAKQLLLETSLSIGQIAEAVGYSDIHYFSRLFKRMEGLPPLQYAESLSRNR